MISTDPAHLTALASRRIYPRDFLWIKARTRADPPVAVEDAYWSDVGAVTAPIQDFASGNTINRTYQGAGQLIQIGQITRTSNLTVLDVQISFLQIGDDANRLIRTYDAKQAEVEIHSGLLDVDTRTLIAPAAPLFKGFVNRVRMPRVAEGSAGVGTLFCKSHSQELSRSNPARRSDEDQRLRSATDAFYASAASVGEWEQYWGRARESTSA